MGTHDLLFIKQSHHNRYNLLFPACQKFPKHIPVLTDTDGFRDSLLAPSILFHLFIIYFCKRNILADNVIPFIAVKHFHLYFNGTFFPAEKFFGK